MAEADPETFGQATTAAASRECVLLFGGPASTMRRGKPGSNRPGQCRRPGRSTPRGQLFGSLRPAAGGDPETGAGSSQSKNGQRRVGKRNRHCLRPTESLKHRSRAAGESSVESKRTLQNGALDQTLVHAQFAPRFAPNRQPLQRGSRRNAVANEASGKASKKSGTGHACSYLLVEITALFWLVLGCCSGFHP